jgi:hypothetical protein
VSKARPLTPAEWHAGEDASRLLKHLQQHHLLGRRPGARRKLRLLAVAFCRSAWGDLTDPGCRAVIETAERFADGAAPRAELERAAATARRNYQRLESPDGGESFRRQTAREMWLLARWTAEPGAGVGTIDLVALGVPLLLVRKHLPLEIGRWAGVVQINAGFLTPLVRCLFGDPFRPVAFAPAWNTSAALGLARGVYDDRAWDRLPILADALEDAGCDEPAVLAHCRDAADHARGCWVIDGLLGRGIDWR